MSYYCQYCNRGFSRKDNLMRHIKEKRCKCLKITPNESNELIQKKGTLSFQHIMLKTNNSEGKIQQLEKKLAEKDQQIAQLRDKLGEPPDESLDLSRGEILQGTLGESNRGVSLLEKQLEQLSAALIKSKEETAKEIAQLKETTMELKKEPRVNNQILQVISIGSTDNYLDMLTQQWGDFDKALEYIKDCALSNLTGDCKLIEKIYIEGCIASSNNYEGDLVKPRSAHIRFLDKSRTRVEYFNEKKEKIVDTKDLFGRKLANNLQNSYLKGVNHLINKNLENHRCPNKFLEEYDLQIWNQHIYDLSDQRYQRKIINQLNIPSIESIG